MFSVHPGLSLGLSLGVLDPLNTHRDVPKALEPPQTCHTFREHLHHSDASSSNTGETPAVLQSGMYNPCEFLLSEEAWQKLCFSGNPGIS